ncbi:MAG: hypothetical protein LBK00_07385 [Treponema sp.]|nr:hypothetical protein [Treponema sp.]
MKKSTLFLTGILALMLVFGLILTGCPTDSGDDKGNSTNNSDPVDKGDSDKGDGQPGRLTVNNLTGNDQNAIVYQNVSPPPATQAEFNAATEFSNMVAFDGYDEDRKTPFDMQMTNEDGKLATFNKTGKYLVVVMGNAGEKFKSDVQFTNGSATIDYNAMTLVSNLPAGDTGKDDDTDKGDTWSKVTALSQLDGTWKGSYSETMTAKEAAEENGEEWDDEKQAAFGDMKVTTSVEITTTINATAKTQAMTTTMTMAFSGGNIDMVWSSISNGYLGQEGVTVDDVKHSITMTINQPKEIMSDEYITDMLAAGLQINQTGEKVKMPADTILGEGESEIILAKQ